MATFVVLAIQRSGHQEGQDERVDAFKQMATKTGADAPVMG
jgi:hypothetical protein